MTAVDPAAASIDIARTKPSSDRVRWIVGDATDVVRLRLDADLAVMTGNVAQVFISDDDWLTTLRSVRSALRDGGWFVFETRHAEARDWENWDIAGKTFELPDLRRATFTRKVTSVALPLVTFAMRVTIDSEVLESTTTLRFRSRAELAHDLAQAGFDVREVRDAADRPGKEMVFIAVAV